MGTTHFSGPVSSPQLEGVSLGPVTGTTFYVDPSNGSDSRDGLSPEEAKATLQAAVDLCTADQGDLIVRMPGTETVTSPVQFNVRGITVMASLMGMPPEEVGERFSTYHASSYAAVVTDPVRCIGLGFEGTTTQDLLIDCEEAGGYNGGFNEFLYCRFGVWGAPAYGVYAIGGAVNKFKHCSFDGLFGGFGTAATAWANDTGGITPAFTELLWNRFQGIGASIPAVLHVSGGTPIGVIYAHNYMGPGFVAANTGIFLDNNNVASSGLVADNWTGLADKATAFTNLTNSTLVFADNHYDE